MTRTMVLVTLLLASSFISAQEKGRIAVLNLKSKGGISEVVVPAINEFFCATIPNYGSYQIIDGKTIADALAKSKSDELINCENLDCLVLIGAGMDARMVLGGTLAKIEGHYEITLFLVDVNNEKLVKGFTQTYTGSEFGLVDELEGYLKMLFGVIPLSPTAKEIQATVTPPPPMPETVTPPPVAAEKTEEEAAAEEESVETEAEPETETTAGAATTPTTAGTAPAATPRTDEGMVSRKEKRDQLPWQKTKSNKIKIGDFEVLSWSDASGKHLIYQGGYSLFNITELGLVDFLNIGYKAKRNSILLEVKMKTESTLLDQPTLHKKTTTDKKILGFGVKYGYEMLYLCNRWVTVTPGITVGYYSYTDKGVVELQNLYTGAWYVPTVNGQREDIYYGYFGACFQVDIGKRFFNDKLGIYLYCQEQLLYVPSILSFTNMGIKFSY